uniref:Uncharacterized protein n=1 Tax=Fagus sylvatica TaxID=28930 RepID=A0A2N9HL87_FAGSY
MKEGRLRRSLPASFNWFSRCSGEKTCFGLAATRWISGKLLRVQPGPMVDRAMWVATGVVLGGSRLLAVEVQCGGAGYDDQESNFFYDKVLSVRQEVIRADRNPCRKTGENHPKCRKQLDSPTTRSCSFLHRSQNHASSIPLESRQCRLSIETNFDQIRGPEDPQRSIQKKVLKRPKTHQNLVEIGQNAQSKQPEKLTQHQAMWSNVELREALYKYGSNFKA